MKIAVFGASGRVGRRVVAEAESRGHEVIKIRGPKHKHDTGDDEYKHADIMEADQIAAAAKGADAAVVTPHLDVEDPDAHAKEPATHVAMSKATLDGLEAAGVLRAVIVGGSGSLRVPTGEYYAFAPYFWKEYYGHATSQTHGWEYIRDAETPVDWSYAIPAFRIHLDEGERTGKFRMGTDQLMLGPDGESRLSFEDFAIIVVDELEQNTHVRQMYTAAY